MEILVLKNAGEIMARIASERAGATSAELSKSGEEGRFEGLSRKGESNDAAAFGFARCSHARTHWCFGRPEEIENASGYYALNAIVRSDLPIEKERAGMEPSPRR
jgi:hypothetical protein